MESVHAKKPFAISLSSKEKGIVKEQAEKRGMNVSKYLRFLITKDIENFKENFIDPNEHAKLQKNLDEKMKENTHLREKVVKKVDELIQKERLTLTKKRIAKKQMHKLQKKLEVIGDDYFDSKDYKKRVSDTIKDFEEGQVLEKQWKLLTEKQKLKANELMYEKNLSLPMAIKKLRNVKLTKEFKRLFK